MPQTIAPALPARPRRQQSPLEYTVRILPTRATPPAPSDPGRASPRMWKVVEQAGEVLAHPRTQWGVQVLTEVLIAAGGMSRPDAALARDAAEAVGLLSGARRKRPGGPRVIIE